MISLFESDAKIRMCRFKTNIYIKKLKIYINKTKLQRTPLKIFVVFVN